MLHVVQNLLRSPNQVQVIQGISQSPNSKYGQLLLVILLVLGYLVLVLGFLVLMLGFLVQLGNFD